MVYASALLPVLASVFSILMLLTAVFVAVAVVGEYVGLTSVVV